MPRPVFDLTGPIAIARAEPPLAKAQVRWGLLKALVPGGRGPPREVIGEAAESPLRQAARLANRLVLRVEGLGYAIDGAPDGFGLRHRWR
jgi:hypothetical protein